MRNGDHSLKSCSVRLAYLIGCWLCFGLLLSVLLSSPCNAEETYRYQRIWPVLPQPWYFNAPESIAVDGDGNVYVADTGNCRIQKLTSEGQFITKWGRHGTANGEFLAPTGIAVDRSGNVYVSDFGDVEGADLYRIQKFASDGRFLAKWENRGNGDGQFNRPWALAVDGAGNVYLADTSNHRIQKLSPDGRFLDKWGHSGRGKGEFLTPGGVAVDRKGHVYVADTGNYRIQKFTSDGRFITKWGQFGKEDGQFALPMGIEVDSSGDVYVADPINHRVQKFTSNGHFLARWENYGNKNGQFVAPSDVAVDKRDNVYVTDACITMGEDYVHNDGVHKFCRDGRFLAKWSSVGSEDGQFDRPWGAAFDRSGNIYVSDTFNHRVQKFAPDGRFLAKWGSYGQEAGQFHFPMGIAIDHQGYVYVVDRNNHRVQKFTQDGRFLLKWGGMGSTEDWMLYYPTGIAVDSDANVYVVNSFGHNIKKFASSGKFITKWGSSGTGEGQFTYPTGITVANSGRLYVVDRYNPCIQEFTLDGKFVCKWGAEGKGDGELEEPQGIMVDSQGYVYVADTNNHRMQKFAPPPQGSHPRTLSPACQLEIFTSKWGSLGNSPDQMTYPQGLAIAQNGDVYAVDSYNNRMQIFKQVPQDSGSKAIIVAGGGPYPGNHLWDATQRCTSFAYRALLYQGFKKENIRYLSSDTSLDLDDNGIPDVHGKDTTDNLQDSIVNWASNALTLLLYLTDHGGEERFVLNEAQEILHAKDLASWLDAIPGTRVIMVYDACFSGSFIKPLISSTEGGRILITSTGPKEQAYFGNLGTLSFSNFLWTQIFNGAKLADSFTQAQKATKLSMENSQCPLVEADGDGKPGRQDDLIALGKISLTSQTSTFNTPPIVGKVRVVPDELHPGSASFVAERVEDHENDTISRIWAVIRPPDFRAGDPGNPLYQLPYVDLTRVDHTDRYEGSYKGFCAPGTYQIAFYAMDSMCNVSTPKTVKLVIDSPLRRKVILAAGWSSNKNLQHAAHFNMQLAYKTLRAQGYPNEDILVLSSMTELEGLPPHETATREHLEYSIKNWAREDTQDLVVYLIGESRKEGFQISRHEDLTGEDLSAWLDDFQSYTPGTRDVILIYDACRSGSFLSMPPGPKTKNRILITSADEKQPACFMVDGLISFSRFFWIQVLNGADLGISFLEAYNAIKKASGSLRQRPLLDANGNGRGNEAEDGQVVASLKIGIGTNFAGNAPVICDSCVGATRDAESSATIWARNIITTGKIDRVLAVIIPPGYRPSSSTDPITDLPTVNLKKSGSDEYRGAYKGLKKSGSYYVAVYAVDTEGNISLPQHIDIRK